MSEGWARGWGGREWLPGSVLLPPPPTSPSMVMSLICCPAVTSPQLLSLGSAAGGPEGPRRPETTPERVRGKGEWGDIKLSFLKCVF